ncbi:MAG TPA: TraR/DksA C4-type zinc finger protein [Acidimicrobiales bacterium]|nr:TraR/DksA C4-type zinc finger protein [Acidimicrobiales bacterium]
MARATTKAAATRSTGSPKKATTTKAAAMKNSSTATPKGGAKTASNGNLDKFLVEQLELLEEERVTYTRQAESLQAEADSLTEDREPGDVQFDEESGEGDTLAVERERDLTLSAQARAAIEEIDLAVAKVHAGTYGLCETCGISIPKERLKALPHAALCVKCKSGGLGLR